MIPLTRLSSVSSGRDETKVPVDESRRGGNDERVGGKQAKVVGYRVVKWVD